MKTYLLLGTILTLPIASCQQVPPAESMTEEQRKVYVEHRRWDLEQDLRKRADSENRR